MSIDLKKKKVKWRSETVVKINKLGHSFSVPQTEQWLRNDTQKMYHPCPLQQL